MAELSWHATGMPPSIIAIVNRPFRLIAPLLLAGVIGVCGVAADQLPARPAPTPDPVRDELQALLDAVQPTWTVSASLHAGSGYKQNLLLSQSDLADSGFARGGFESLVWHVPREKIDYFAFFNGEYTRYFKRTVDRFGTTIDHEEQAFGGFEWRFRQPERLSLTVDAQVYHLDQEFDVSNSNVPQIAALKLNGVKIGPTARWTFPRHIWLEANAMLDWQKFQDGYNDARIREAVTRLGWTPDDRIELSLGATDTRRAYLRRPPIAKRGTLPGLLTVDEQQAEGRADITWGARRRWTTRTRGGFLHYTDRAEGFLNYQQPFAAQEIEWADAKWLVHAEVEWRYKRFEHQTVGSGVPPLPAAVKHEDEASLRIERKLSERWTVYVAFQDERARSNDVIASYHTKEGLLGARWSWEK